MAEYLWNSIMGGSSVFIIVCWWLWIRIGLYPMVFYIFNLFNNLNQHKYYQYHRIMVPELLPVEYLGPGSSIVGTVNWLTNIIVSTALPFLISTCTCLTYIFSIL